MAPSDRLTQALGLIATMRLDRYLRIAAAAPGKHVHHIGFRGGRAALPGPP